MLHNNSSVYDPYWSVIPIFIVILWMVHLSLFNYISYIILFGVIVWGLRLTINWGTDFKGFIEEDFRYVDFRKTFKKFYWLISFLGIHMFPTLIVYLGLYPVYYIFTNSVNNELFIYLGTVIMLLSAILSYFSDTQLRKHKLNSKKESIKTGVWKYSRHPNYLAELMFWFGIFIASLSIEFNVINSLGIMGMILLFNLYSIPKMEKRLLNNKSDYGDIVETVPRLLPLSFFKKIKEYSYGRNN
jgi:steroid 5-alpha reductase family enzyme